MNIAFMASLRHENRRSSQVDVNVSRILPSMVSREIRESLSLQFLGVVTASVDDGLAHAMPKIVDLGRLQAPKNLEVMKRT